MIRKLSWLFLLLAWPGLAFAQGGRFDSVAQKSVQNFLAPIPGALITVCAAGATGTPCSPVVPTSPVTLCTDSTCAVAAPNPFPADVNGNFGGWLLPGNYTYSVTATGVTGKLFNLTIPAITPVNLATQTSGLLNLATQVTGTLPGANYAAVNLAAGNVNGGATGVLPAANLPATTSNCSGVQFAQGLNAGMTPVCVTPPTFVASGASHAVGYVPDPGASAGTTRFLREDATWFAPPVAPTVTSINLAAATGNCSTQTFLTPGANALYRVGATVTITTNAGTSSTTPTIAVSYTDADSNTTVSTTAGTIVNSSGANTVGPVPTLGPIYINAKSGTAITFSCSGYASNPAATMAYTVHARLEGTF